MTTLDMLCVNCEEKCDWYKETVAKGNVPFGCLKEIEDEERENGES